MKLRTLHLTNFRGVLSESIDLKDYSLLVGCNNAGKSTIIDAIRAFYEKDGFKFNKATDFPYIESIGDESWIELTFDLDSDEWDSLADEYKGDPKQLRARKYFLTQKKTLDGKNCSGSIFGYKADGTLSDEPFYGAKNVQSGKFGDLVYIPAISKVDEHAKLSGPSALRDLLTDIMSDVVAAGKAYQDFSASVHVFSEAIRQETTSDGRSLSGFEGELNNLLNSWESEFHLKFPPPSAGEIVKSMLSWELQDKFHGNFQAITNYGSGFQRHFIYSLIYLGSKYVGQKPSKKGKDFTPTMTLVLFEEPEAFLHPPQQDLLARSLMSLSKSDHWQILCATHSPQFVSRNAADIPAIVRLQRSSGQVDAFQIDDEAWTTIVDANQAIMEIAAKFEKMKKKLHEDDAKPEMEAIKHFLWLNPDRSNVFFSNHVLLVEGTTEVALINRLVGDGLVKIPSTGFYVLDCVGKWNIHRFMNLFLHFGISHSVVHDDDLAKEENAEINQLIKDSSNEFSQSIQTIPGRLETFLEIKSEVSPHRKPQHVLYLYETGEIKSENIKKFCSIVQDALGS